MGHGFGVSRHRGGLRLVGRADALVGALGAWWVRAEGELIAERISFHGHERGAVQMYVWVRGKVTMSTQGPKESREKASSKYDAAKRVESCSQISIVPFWMNSLVPSVGDSDNIFLMWRRFLSLVWST